MNIYEKYMSIIGILSNLTFYLQAYKIFFRHSAEAISGPAFIISFIGISSWLAYGILLKNKPLIISNSFGIVGVCLVLAGVTQYGNFSWQ